VEGFELYHGKEELDSPKDAFLHPWQASHTSLRAVPVQNCARDDEKRSRSCHGNLRV
jgi:hypothetical protein